MSSRDDALYPRNSWRQPWRAIERRALAAAMLLLPACGETKAPTQAVGVQPGDAGVPQPTDPAPDVLGDAGGAEPPAVPQPPPLPPGIAQLPGVESTGWPRSDVTALGVLEMLQTHCSACHLDGGNGEGFARGFDLATLIGSGLIVPGSSASSPLLARISNRSASAEPRHAGPSVGDLALLADFIDQLSLELPSCQPGPFVALDGSYGSLLADLRSRPEEDRPYLRYVGLVDASNRGLCGPELDRFRRALFKLVNGVSDTNEIRLPTAVDDAELVYRIDLRDYGWARAIDLDGDGAMDYGDGWQAILPSAAPYAVELGGPEATALSTEAGTPVPYMSVGAFIRAVSVVDVYRALLRLPVQRDDMDLAFDLDIYEAIENGAVRRALFKRTVPNAVYMPSRYSSNEAPQRTDWLLHVQDDVQGNNFYSEPLDPGNEANWTQAIMELPNGLHAYSLSVRMEGLLAGIPLSCVGSCFRPEQDPVACFGCHAGGILPVADVFRRTLEEYYPLEYTPEDYADLFEIYARGAELERIIANDNARYQAALTRLGIQPGMPDPVSRVYLDFDNPLHLERAAAELGVPPQTLLDQLGALPPAFAPLAAPSATIGRSAFSDAFVAAACVVHAGSRNRPASCP